MKTSTRLSLLGAILGITVCLGSGGVFAQDDASVELKGIEVTPADAKPGDTVTATLTVEPTQGWHVYGSMQNPAEGQPITLILDDAAGLIIAGGAKVPPGKPHDFFGMETYWVEGTFDIVQQLEVPEDAEPGERSVTGAVSYMICNDSVCLPPAQFPVSFAVNVVAAAAGDSGGDGDDGGTSGEVDDDLKVRVTSTPAAAGRGGEVIELTAGITVVDGWHVYGELQNPENGPPIELEVGDASLGFNAEGSTRRPPGEKHEAAGIVTHWVLGSFEIGRSVRIPTGTNPGTYKVSGEVSYISCENKEIDGTCVIEAVPVSYTVTVEPGEARPERSGAVASGNGGGLGDEPVTEQPLWGFILLAIGGGLFALVMPCTYPMIPITMSFFTKQAAERGGNVLPLSLAYGFGIVAIFVAIALIFGTVIITFAVHPITNLIIGIIFVVFALSLFGVFILQPPAFLMNAAGRASNVGGYLGVFLMGTALVVTSFTCTAPFVGLVLSAGATGEGASTARVALGMGVFGLTMAIPFVFLSLVPGKLQQMPRSGEWMNTIKVFLGFVELAAAWKFFSNAELVWQLKILPRELFLLMWAGTFGLAGAFLLGWINLKNESKDGIGPLRMTMGVCTMLFALYCMFGAAGNRLDRIMIAIAPPYTAMADGGETAEKPKLYVENDYGKALEKARREGKQLLVNFTGYT